jgi:hypothetical protein
MGQPEDDRMAAKRKGTPVTENQKKTIGITIRVEAETNRVLSAILSLKGMTLSGFLQSSIRQFIRDNYAEAKKLLDIEHIAGIINDDRSQ